MPTKAKAAIALGTFDGLHRGHRKILNAALNADGLMPVAVTFNEPPKCYTSKDPVPVLMSSERKIKLLKQMGFSEIISLEYKKVHDMTAKEFLDFLFSKYNVRLAVCGDNYRFGKGGAGNTEYLSDYCKEHNANAMVFPMEKSDGKIISSTFIRELIAEGKIKEANALLGQPFSFEAEVVHGAKRGRELGFPTINQTLERSSVTPKFGVYASRVTIDDKKLPSITNIGLRPTFQYDEPISETHILGFKGDLYGKKIEVELLGFLREEKKFKTADELKETISDDLKNSEKVFKSL